MDVLGSQEEGAGGEIQLTDALAWVIGQQPFHGVTFAGTRSDCGDKSGFVTAMLALALACPDIAPAVRAFLAAARPGCSFTVRKRTHTTSRHSCAATMPSS